MKQAFVLSILICSFLNAAFAQLEETRALTSFNKVHYEGQGSIFLEKGSHPSIRVEALDSEHLKHLIVEVIDETLYVRYNMHSPGHPVFARPRLDVYLRYEQLDALTVSGKVRVDANETISTHQLDLHAEGFVDLKLDLEVQHFHAFVDGNVAMVIAGKTFSQNIHLEGQGTINAFDLVSENTIATVNGTGELYIHVREVLEAVAGGLSKIVYKGDPIKKAFNKTGKVSITQRQI